MLYLRALMVVRPSTVSEKWESNGSWVLSSSCCRSLTQDPKNQFDCVTLKAGIKGGFSNEKELRVLGNQTKTGVMRDVNMARVHFDGSSNTTLPSDGDGTAVGKTGDGTEKLQASCYQ